MNSSINLVPNFHNVDCMQFMKSIGDKSVDFILTDIPYDFVEKGTERSIKNLNFGSANALVFNLQSFLDECLRIAKGSICIFCGWNQFSEIDMYFQAKTGTTRPIIWEKTNPFPLNGEKNYLSSVEFAVWFRFPNGTFNAKCKSNVFRYPLQPGDKIKTHPTKKNVDLFKELVLDNTNPGDIVFDPCCGSGTTIEACLQTNRRFIACELDKTFYDTTEKYLYQNYSMLLAMC